MIRRLALTAIVVVAALPWMLASLVSTEAAGQGSGNAARLVEEMRAASSEWSFAGTVALEWRDTKDAAKTHSTTVSVAATYGSVEVTAGSNKVVDQLGFTYVIGGRGGLTVLLAPISRAVPSADHAWTLSSRPGPTIAGRPTTIVVATRDGRTAAQRLYMDAETHLFLGRDVLDASGKVQRSLRFTSFNVVGGQVPANASAGTSTGSGSATLRRVPEGYRAPASTGGYVLVAKAKDPDGGVQLSYSDGLFTISVSERQGDLDWDALASGGTSTTVAGHAARRYSEAGGDVLVWEGGGVVFTCVSDAPLDVTATMISGLSPTGRTAVEKAVDFVLGPFGWH